MKKLVLLLLIICFGHFVNSQDLVVTHSGDSLNCKITKINQDYIYFTFMYNNEVKQTLLARSGITAYQKSFYLHPELPLEAVINSSYSKFRIAFRGGFSYLFAKIPSGVDPNYSDYLKNLKSGYHLGIDVNYFFNELYGLGFKYSIFKTKGSVDNIQFVDDQGNILRLTIADNRSDFFVGPTFITRYLSHNKSAFIIAGSLGYLGYNNDASIGGIPFNLKGGTFGIVFDIGYDFSISNEFSLGFFAAVTLGSLSKITYDDGFTNEVIDLGDEQRESMSRIDLSIVISFNK